MKATLILLFVLVPTITAAQATLEAKFSQYAKSVKGRVGVYATLLETGETASYHADEKFPMQSVYKIPIAMAVLDKVDKGEFTLTQKVHVTRADFIPKNGHSPLRDQFPIGVDITIEKLLRYNMVESDGTACDVLLRILGGTKYAGQYVRRLGVTNMTIATTEKIQLAQDTIQYQNWATPRATVQLLTVFYQNNTLSVNSRQLILSQMISSIPGANRLKGLLPKSTVVAHKTGTAGTYDDFTRATNDVGIITLPNGKHLVIAVYIRDSNDSLVNRELCIANIAKAAFDHWAAGK